MGRFVTEWENIPRRAHEVISGVSFPFESWAAGQRFRYPAWARHVLRRCGSAAEAFLIREFAERQGCEEFRCDDQEPGLRVGDTALRVQAKVRGYYVDVLVQRGAGLRFAIEVDGQTYHRMSPEQVQDDYLRERRLMFSGLVLIRFTAAEVYRDPAECWRQIDAILEARR